MNNEMIVLLGLNLGLGISNAIVSFIILHFVLSQYYREERIGKKQYDWVIKKDVK